MTIDAEYLLSRLPAFYRERDALQGDALRRDTAQVDAARRDGPLRALLSVIAEQGALLEADIARLYDNWFIETCDEWVVPYIGDLLGVRSLHGVEGTLAPGQRALVANTLRLRRRKGTLPVIEQVAFDSTGWRARAVEFFELLQATQHVNHVRLHSLRTPDLRDTAALERLNGPFERAAHTVEVRTPPAGRYNIANIGVYLWRLQAYPVKRATARPHTTTPGLFHIDPLMRDLPLFNVPHTETAITHLAEPINVPEPLSRRVVHDELTGLRQALADGRDAPGGRFPADDQDPALLVWIDGVRVDPTRLIACNLSAIPGVTPEDWRRPSMTVSVTPASPDALPVTFPSVAGQFMVSVDPVLGRIALPAGTAVNSVEVSSAYGFPGDVGAGPYDRRPQRADADAAEGLLRRSDFARIIEVPAASPSIAAAIASVVSGEHTLILWDSDSAESAAPVVNLPGTHLAIEAVNRRRPVLVGDFTLSGDDATRLTLGGILMNGCLRLQGELQSVDIRHCSLVPAAGGIEHTGDAPGLTLTLRRTLCGPVTTTAAIASMQASDCVFDAGVAASALVLTDSSMALRRCTVWGRTQTTELEASNCLFTERVESVRGQDGCVRFSYVPEGSRTPRRYRCQPDMVMKDLPDPEAAAEAIRVTPSFTSLSFGHPAYAQLLLSCAPEIRAGADDGAEMGVWNLLQQPQREANLRLSLDEYVRFGLEAGVFFVN